MLSTGSLMSVAYTVVLTHVLRGSNSKWLIRVIVILLVSQLFLIVFGAAWVKFWVKTDQTFLTDSLIACGIGLYYLFFNLGHFLLADKYGTIAKVVPATLDGQLTEPEPVFGKVTYWLLYASNIVSALSYGLACGLYYGLKEVEGRDVPPWLEWSKIGVTYWVRICALIAGFVLVWAVIKIRKYFKEKNATDYLNTNMLWRHGISFGLYLATSMATTTALLFVNLHTNDDNFKKYFDIYSGVFIADLFC